MKSSIAISCVPELADGPWIYLDALDVSIAKVAASGSGAVQLSSATYDEILGAELSELLDGHLLKLSCVETDVGKAL